jgi:hypothetical protein
MEKGFRVDSRVLEERLQKAVSDGHRFIEIIAHGQHGIGGRLWKTGTDPVVIRVLGTSGQRLGSMGFSNTFNCSSRQCDKWCGKCHGTGQDFCCR